MRRASRTVPPRPGFTLIEILVVLAIIALLLTLSAGAFMSYISSQQNANTVNLIRELQGALHEQWSRTRDNASNALSSASNFPLSVNLIAYAGNNPDRARVIAIKMQLYVSFPASFNEALSGITNGPQTVPPLGTFIAALQGGNPAGGQPTVQGVTSAMEPAYESSILLLLALQRNGILKSGDLQNSIASVTLSNGVQVEYIRDTWGNPIVYSRAPVRSYWATAGTSSNYYDPDDPSALLLNYTNPFVTNPATANSPWWPTTGPPSSTSLTDGRDFFKNLMYGLQTPAPTTWPQSTPTVALVPQIVSAGPDGQYGFNPASLFQTFDDIQPGTANLSALAQDNITSATLVGANNY